ncbi:hypothetical protein BCR33DRAFT_454557 [Rhizoclosmatium globosum]|uniref:Uncharacterized protein n=1 Tax=Rhizoclosmatium globosum TaxID=329046 RepID=A0A1Y2CWR4_9FUNG|nr:hypothetical protein BCR33DRAFT_454557 [Rhizoclosmatium globosum]|eukprot:ORY51427.1 hypothetical protein BCR33DRAFT_454557 [Rhizoclosmatium globosum]
MLEHQSIAPSLVAIRHPLELECPTSKIKGYLLQYQTPLVFEDFHGGYSVVLGIKLIFITLTLALT